jgi:hypothetical protein
MARAGGAATGARTPAQVFALAFGAVYLLVGLVGFAVTGFDQFADNTNEALIIFEINPLHNIVHILLGAVYLGASRVHATARSVNMALGVALLVVFLLGLIGALEWLSIDGAADPDNYLHAATGALSLYFGTAGAEGTRPATA